MNIKSSTYTMVDGVESKECNLCHRMLPVTDFYRTKRDRYTSRCKECQGKYLKRWKTANAARAKAIATVEEYPCRLCKSFSRTVNDKRTGYCIHYHKGVKLDHTCGYWRPDTTLKFKI